MFAITFLYCSIASSVLNVSPITDIDYASCSQSTALDGSSGGELPTGYTNMWISYYIEVDGGINEETAKLCKDAGVDVLVAGSYLFASDNMKERIKLLKK